MGETYYCTEAEDGGDQGITVTSSMLEDFNPGVYIYQPAWEDLQHIRLVLVVDSIEQQLEDTFELYWSNVDMQLPSAKHKVTEGEYLDNVGSAVALAPAQIFDNGFRFITYYCKSDVFTHRYNNEDPSNVFNRLFECAGPIGDYNTPISVTYTETGQSISLYLTY